MFNERDAQVRDSDPNAEPRQDDYDIGMGAQTLDNWIAWNRHGTASTLYLDGHAISRTKADACMNMCQCAQLLTLPTFYS